MAVRRGVGKDAVRMRYSRLRQRIYDVTTVQSNNGDEKKTEVEQKKEQTIDEPSTQGMEDNDCARHSLWSSLQSITSFQGRRISICTSFKRLIRNVSL